MRDGILAAAWLSLFTLAAAAAQAPGTRPNPASSGPIEWMEPDRTPVEGALYKTFHSPAARGEVSYQVYLPPGCEQQPGSRYPVLYELPASGQTTKAGAHEFYFLTNVKGHNRAQCLNTMGDGALAFFTSALVRPARP